MESEKIDLIESIKAAMGTYSRHLSGPGVETWWIADKDGAVIESGLGWPTATAHALDLNARAVIDAIVGALRWEKLGQSKCYFGLAFVGAVAKWPYDVGGMRWGTVIGTDHHDTIFHATESEARAAVETAFKAALLGDQPKATA